MIDFGGIGGRTLTGVSGTLSAAHRDRASGQLHGHDWLITGWFEGGDARDRKAQLNAALARYDHDLLPDDLAWSEDLARWVRLALDDATCVQVDIARPLLGFYARWCA